MFPTSIIVPTYNEGKQIETLLNSITLHLKEQLSNIEIIIINNGSIDINNEEAAKFLATAYRIDKTSVGTARNFGASKATNELLIFLDADMEITSEWAQEIQNVSELIHNDFNQITGNKVTIPTNPNWIEKYWFCEIPNQKIKYINSANLVISKQLFLKLNGFDEALISGEDYDLSMRAIKSGASLSINSKLIAIHHGYPKNISNFIKREIWHGTGDFISLKSIMQSKVAIATLGFIFLHMIIFVSSFYYMPITLFAIVILISLLLLLSWKKYYQMPIQYILINTIVNYFYFLGRSISFFKAIITKIIYTNKLDTHG